MQSVGMKEKNYFLMSLSLLELGSVQLELLTVFVMRSTYC